MTEKKIDIDYDKLFELHESDIDQYKDLLYSYLYKVKDNDSYIENPDILQFVKCDVNKTISLDDFKNPNIKKYFKDSPAIKRITLFYSCKKTTLTTEEKVRYENVISLQDRIIYLSNYIDEYDYIMENQKSDDAKLKKFKDKIEFAERIKTELKKIYVIMNPFGKYIHSCVKDIIHLIHRLKKNNF